MSKSRSRPLRIKYDPDNTYVVITFDLQVQQCEDPHHSWPETAISAPLRYISHVFKNLKTKTSAHAHAAIFRHASATTRHLKDDSPLVYMEPILAHGYEDIQGLVYERLLPPLHYLFDTCKSLHKLLESSVNGTREAFQQAKVNAQVYHSMTMKEIKRKDEYGIRTTQEKEDRKQMLKELDNLGKQVTEWDYQNTCRSSLLTPFCRCNLTASLLFIALPSNLNSWDDSDPSSRQFRVYFLCDNWKQGGALEEYPKHVHKNETKSTCHSLIMGIFLKKKVLSLPPTFNSANWYCTNETKRAKKKAMQRRVAVSNPSAWILATNAE